MSGAGDPLSFYPPDPAPGSNAIGSFEIGVGQIGTIPAFNWKSTIISQYANSPRLLTLIADFNAYLDPTQRLDDFFDKMFNVATAQGYGLDCWGRIVGVTRTLNIANEGYFGFEEATTLSANPYNTAPFYSGAPLTSNFNLTDDAFRQLIFAKALANICDGSIPAINQLLLNLFPGRGNAYVQDGSIVSADYFGFEESGQPNAFPYGQAPFYSGQSLGRMAMTYVFEFTPTPVEASIITQSGVLPQPTGVAVSYQTL